ncbi:MAG: hypothetical protein K2I20_06935 [Clostridia bacterium]|nr:hypothetical protein [Clostridia bacterium]
MANKKKKYGELTDKERKTLGKKYAKADGADGLTIFLFVVIALALCFSVTFGICGFIFMGDGEEWLIYGIVGCAATAVLVGSIFLVRLWRRARLAKNKVNLNELLNKYNKDTLVECKKFWKLHHWLYMWFTPAFTLSNYPEDRAFNEAIKRAAWGHSSGSNYYTPPASSNNSTRVKLKDGKELHTEERFGDYKTYLYDESGKNTRLHISGDKVLDDNFNEVGSFDSSGKFNPKN